MTWRTVEVSTNSGVSYTSVAVKNSFGGLTNFTSGLWVSNTVDISSFAGKTIKLRFRFDTVDNFYNSTEGWYVDNIVIRSTSLEQPPVITVQPASQTNPAGSNATFSVMASGSLPHELFVAG